MADVMLLFAGALAVLGAAVTVVLVARSGRRRKALERRQRPARLRAELNEIDQRIRRVNQAATDADLDRLEQPEE